MKLNPLLQTAVVTLFIATVPDFAGAARPGGGDADAALVPPEALAATAVSESQINLTWSDTNNGENGYLIERSFDATSGFVQIAKVPKNSTGFQDTGLSSDTTHYYRVRVSGRKAMTSSYSSVASATTWPAATPTPTRPPVVDVAPTATPTSPPTPTATLPPATATPTFPPPTPTLPAPTSTPIPTRTPTPQPTTTPTQTPTPRPTATATPAPPSVPQNLSATAVSCSQVNLAWSASSDMSGSGLKGYNVYRSNTFVEQVATNSASDSGLSASSIYAYQVTAVDNAGNESARSTTASTSTPACNEPPVANAGPDKDARVGDSVTFDAAGSYDPDGTISSYAWTFGDGSMANGTVVSHSYGAPGSYTARLTVTDNGGMSSTDTASVQVTHTVGGTGGSHVWSRDFGGATPSDSATGMGVAVAGSGEVVVVGRFTGTVDFSGTTLTSAGADDAFVSARTAGGGHAWTRRFGGTGYDIGSAVAVADNGDIVVVGAFAGSADFGGGALTSAGSYDLFIARYSSAGTHLWSRRFGGTNLESAAGIAIDPSGNILVGGYFYGAADFGGAVLTSAGSSDTFVAKYSSSGSHVWSVRLGGSGADETHALAVDSSGNVAIVGDFTAAASFGGATFANAGGRDIFLAKYSSSGSHLWSKAFGSSGWESSYAVAMDSTGAVSFSGTFDGTVGFGGQTFANENGADIVLAKYSSSGAHLWSKSFGGSSLSGAERPNALAVDTEGNLALTGWIVDYVDFGGGPLYADVWSYDAFVAKFDPTGAHMWSQRYGVDYDDHGRAVAFDVDGSVLATGDFYRQIDFGGGTFASPGGVDAYVVKLTP